MTDRKDDEGAYRNECPAGRGKEKLFHNVYRRNLAEKLNTVVLLLNDGWREWSQAVETILQMGGFVCISDVAWPEGQIQREHTLVFTDSVVQARRFSGKGFVCVGCAGAGECFFDGAGLVVETPEALDISYLEEYLCHMLGEAVQVAETPRLILKEISLEEIDGLCAISRQCDCRFLLDPEDGGFFERERLVAYIKQAYRLYGYGLWSVLLKGAEPQQRTLIGCCGLSDVLWEDGTNRVELQYLLGEKYRRQGLGYEMCCEALRLAAERVGCSSVWLRVHPDNLPSLKLAEKLGFHRETEGGGSGGNDSRAGLLMFSRFIES